MVEEVEDTGKKASNLRRMFYKLINNIDSQ